jgi:pimeloyl-ACP methyl ester carboxylesterase
MPDYFIPHHALVTAEGKTPERWLHMLHGVFGSGANWRPFARRVTEACPSWGVVLVDLRCHGLSSGAPPPHTLDAAADDVLRLEQHLGIAVDGVAGHSFGGKVGLAYLARRAAPVSTAFVLDVWPGPRPADRPKSGTQKVLETLESVPLPLPSRERFVEILREAGYGRAISDWLAMSLRRTEDGFRLRLDLPAIRALLEDFRARDLINVVEDGVGARALHLVVGGASDVVDGEARARLAEIPERNDRVRLHVLESAGHWLHADDPDGLFHIFRDALDATG